MGAQSAIRKNPTQKINPPQRDGGKTLNQTAKRGSGQPENPAVNIKENFPREAKEKERAEVNRENRLGQITRQKHRNAERPQHAANLGPNAGIRL